MREVLGFSAREVAESLGTTIAALNSALQRARKIVDEQLPVRSQQATLLSLADAGLRALVEGYVDAWQNGDVDSIVAMLSEDAKFAMPPETTWYRGREAIRSFLMVGPLTERWRFVPVRSNGQLAFGTYAWDQETGTFVASAIDVLTLLGATVDEITAFITPEIFPRFGLAKELSP